VNSCEPAQRTLSFIGDQQSRGGATISSNVILKVIEEFADGFLILNPQKEVIFFNDVLLRMTGLRSRDILAPDNPMLHGIAAGIAEERSQVVEAPGPDGVPHRFSVTSFPMDSEGGTYYFVRVRHQAEELSSELATYVQNYEMLFANIGDALLTVDLNGRILTANPAFYRLVEVEPPATPADINGFYVYREELDDKLRRLVEHDTIYNLETHLYTVGKSIRRVLDTSWVIRDARGKPVGYTAQLKDVTYVKNLESRLTISERSYSMLFDTILSSIIIVDPLGRIVNVNYTAEKLYGYSLDEIGGMHFDEVFRWQPSRPTIEEIMEQVKHGGGCYVEAEVPRPCKDGSLKYTYASYTRILDSSDQEVAYSIMEKDLTERIDLERKLGKSFEQIRQTQSATIIGFARLTEYRDQDSGTHLKRIREYTKVLALTIRDRPEYEDYITSRYVEDLSLACVLHDVGKLNVDRSILFKPGRLTEDEFESVKQHVVFGGQALTDLDEEISEQSFVTMAKEIAYFHHERWDGKGYPEGRRGQEIPLSARIVAVADVYDTLTSTRPYKEALTHQEAFELIRAERGTHFDPDVVDAFVQRSDVFRRIKMFNEFEEDPQSIDDLLRGTGNNHSLDE
jgi:PAS domain S-box-containing protein